MTEAVAPSSVSEASMEAGQLDRKLARLAIARAWLKRWAWLLMGLWIVCAGWVCVMLADAMWHLPAMARTVAGIALLATLAVALAGMLAIRRRKAFHHQLADALRLEACHGLRGNPLVNGLCLSHDPSSEEGLTRLLQQRAIAQADAVATQVDIRPAQDKRALKRHRAILLGVGVLALLMGAVMPRLFVAGFWRLADPWGDHPPFSLTRFVVDWPADGVLAGDDALVRVTLLGRQPDSVDWVELDDAGRERSRWPMEQVRQGMHERRLRELRQPVWFRLSASTGYTRAMRIDVKPRPADDVAERDTPPVDEQLEDSPVLATTQGSATQPASQDTPSSNAQAMVDSQRQALLQAAREVLRAAGAESRTSPDPAAWSRDMAASAERFNQLAKESLAATEAMRQADSSTTDAQAGSPQPLDAFAQLLGQLSIPGQPAPPAGNENDPQAVSRWAQGLASAAKEDVERLAGPAGDAQSAQAQSQAGNAAGESDSPSGQVAAGGAPAVGGEDHGRRVGVEREVTGPGAGQADASRARGQEVPPGYREMVNQYFDRIQQDRP